MLPSFRATTGSLNIGNADVKVQSIDGVIFDLHSAMLSAYTGTFPGPEINTVGEVVSLTEPANVLRICFDFIYPKIHPDLEDIEEFELLAAVAEAVGKYQIFSAMYTCNTRLRAFIPSHAKEILVYAIKHDYLKLTNEAAHYLARSPFTPVLKQLPPPFVVSWSLYRDAWTAVFKEAVGDIIKTPPSSMRYCHERSSLFGNHQTQSNSDTGRICSTCRSLLYAWVANLEEINMVASLNDRLQSTCDKSIRMSGCCAAIERDFDGLARPDFKCTHVIGLAKSCRTRILGIPSFDSFLPGNSSWKENF